MYWRSTKKSNDNPKTPIQFIPGPTRATQFINVDVPEWPNQMPIDNLPESGRLERLINAFWRRLFDIRKRTDGYTPISSSPPSTYGTV